MGAISGLFDIPLVGQVMNINLMDAMLTARMALWKEYCRFQDLVVKMVAQSELCRRFMAIPSVGPMTALSFVTAADDL